MKISSSELIQLNTLNRKGAKPICKICNLLTRKGAKASHIHNQSMDINELELKDGSLLEADAEHLYHAHYKTAQKFLYSSFSRACITDITFANTLGIPVLLRYSTLIGRLVSS